MPPDLMRVLAMAGSLRAASINAAFCRAAARLAPADLSISVYPGLGDLPLFNPDREIDPPPSVRHLRQSVRQADALLIASPEYAHGVSGAMKNALDWLVSDEGFVGKPVALVNTSPRAHHAYDALRETLLTMSAVIVEGASRDIALLGACVTEDAMVNSGEVAESIRHIGEALRVYLLSPEWPGPSGRTR
ncbi:NADPH-dependent FMN reductase [Thiomonas delicata]|uniref:NADPH-dependent FMN reductase n=2 Tax=Thiomonas TaxID=32012 RepID=A0A238D2G3_THIDL|nr:NADPH-dependent FMN reductase [Thiomonas delicata]SBP87456.1 NADPH-dependent FMN reductase [Thiomonas delicata]